MSVKVKIKVEDKSEYIQMPAIALRGLVLFPENLISFDVGRDKSVKAIDAAMKNNRQIYLVPQMDFELEDPKAEDLYDVGVVAEVRQVLKLHDNVIKVLVETQYRAKTVEIAGNEHIIATIKPYPLRKVRTQSAEKVEALVRTIKDSFDKFLSVSPKISKEVISNVFLIDDANELCEYIASNVIFKVEDKMTVLSENSVEKRLSFVLEFLNSEYKIQKIENEIKQKVQIDIDKSQKEYYLRQQMKTISEELDESENLQKETEEYKAKVIALQLKKENEEKLLKEISRLERMSPMSQEATVSRTYIETCLDIPWNNVSKEQINVIKAKNILDKGHYGLTSVKDKVLEILSVRKLSGNTKGQILCLVGPPGVGKTSIASSIAECLGRSFVRISLGGVRDEAEIRGHRRTYVGALPGKIVNALIQAKTKNPVILLDEIDKMSGDFKGDPASALLEVLDIEQNHNFKDHYVDMAIDLSEVCFIATANNYAGIPAPLMDRMDIIELSSYTREEKFNIAKRHLIPKQLEKNGMKPYVKFTDSGLYYIIDSYTKEAGVRNLERTIVDILRKSAKMITTEGVEKVTVNKAVVQKLLGVEKYHPNPTLLSDNIGVANGLAWTSVGGEMLPIEVTVIPNGAGRLELTGSLGEVMKESCKIALSYIRSNAEKYNIEQDFSKIDIHIHAPEGAVPKDGPSAGITLTTALISVLTKRAVKGTVAMTGEVTLQGRVLAIGGLKEKSMAAYREGIKTVIIPFDNIKHLEDIDPKVKECVKFVPVKTIDEALAVNLT